MRYSVEKCDLSLVCEHRIAQLERMARYRSFLFPEATVGTDFLVLDPRESHHLVRVFRAQVGASIEVLDGRGRRYLGTIEVANGKAVRVAVDSVEVALAQTPRLILLQAVPKGKAMDMILRMATEIGVSEIYPVFTDQGEHLQPKLDKWRLTMIEACKQCGLSYLPQLAKPLALRDWLPANAPSADSLRIVASLETGSLPLLDTLNQAGEIDSIVIAVGPAGDFSEAEYQSFSEAGFKAVRLGANVLRTETAAAYLLSVVDQCTRSSFTK